MNKNQGIYQKPKLVVGIIILLLVAGMHAFRLGNYLNGEAHIYYYSYASDVVMPFAVYFMLCMNEIHLKFIRKWWVKAILVFSLTTITEILQAFGYYVLGTTFDYFDILMFGIGVLSAVLFDTIIFRRLIPNWKLPI